eukprot:2256272-Pleurochrysis_carterae.AAC.2
MPLMPHVAYAVMEATTKLSVNCLCVFQHSGRQADHFMAFWPRLRLRTVVGTIAPSSHSHIPTTTGHSPVLGLASVW